MLSKFTLYLLFITFNYKTVFVLCHILKSISCIFMQKHKVEFYEMLVLGIFCFKTVTLYDDNEINKKFQWFFAIVKL